MAFPLYLAMTAAEIRENSLLPPNLAYMGCLFSPYGTGLSNRPKDLPEGSLLILSDRTPIHGHDPALVGSQLAELAQGHRCSGILLDFQRPECEETANLVKLLVSSLTCPVAVSATYAGDLPCPVLLPPAPLDIPLSSYLNPWKGREIWLEAALDGLEITLTPSGYAASPVPHPALDEGFSEKGLHCHYRIHTEEDRVTFSLFHTREDLDALLREAKSLGVTQAVGLWQELK